MNNEKLDIWLKIAQLFLIVSSIPISLFLYFKYESLQYALIIKNHKLQNEIASIKLTKDQTIGVDVQQEFKANPIQEFDDGTFAFNVQISFSIKNLSSYTLMVPYHTFYVFLGKELHEQTLPYVIYPISAPALNYSEKLNQNKWNLSHCEITRSSRDISIPKSTYHNSCPLKTGGWGVGTIRPNELIEHDYRFIVRAKPIDYISYIVEMQYGVDKNVLKEKKEYISMSDLSTFSELQKK